MVQNIRESWNDAKLFLYIDPENQQRINNVMLHHNAIQVNDGPFIQKQQMDITHTHTQPIILETAKLTISNRGDISRNAK